MKGGGFQRRRLGVGSLGGGTFPFHSGWGARTPEPSLLQESSKLTQTKKGGGGGFQA